MISAFSTVSVCLPVHTVTQTHTHTHTHTQATLTKKHTQANLKTQANKCKVLIENQHFHSTTVSQYSATKKTHTHSSDESPSKTPGGRVDSLFLSK